MLGILVVVMILAVVALALSSVAAWYTLKFIVEGVAQAAASGAKKGRDGKDGHSSL